MNTDRPLEKKLTPGTESVAERRNALDTFRITGLSPMYGSAVSKDLLLVVFYGETQVPTLKRLLTEAETVSRGNQRRVSLITIVRPGAPMLESDARTALQDGFAYLIAQGVDIQSAVVFEGTGAKASLVRSVVTALSILTRLAVPFKVFASAEEAAKWHGARIKSLEGDKLTALSSIIKELDARHAAMTEAARVPNASE